MSVSQSQLWVERGLNFVGQLGKGFVQALIDEYSCLKDSFERVSGLTLILAEFFSSEDLGLVDEVENLYINQVKKELF